MAFFKLTSFKNAALPNTRILKTFFTLTLKCGTYALILTFFLALHFLFVSALVLFLVFRKPSLSSLCIVSSFRDLFLKTFFTLTLKRATYAFIILSSWHFTFSLFLLSCFFSSSEEYETRDIWTARKQQRYHALNHGDHKSPSISEWRSQGWPIKAIPRAWNVANLKLYFS